MPAAPSLAPTRPRTISAPAVDAVVLSDGQLPDAYLTARSLLTTFESVTVLERAPGRSTGQPAPEGQIGFGLADWAADSSAISATGTADWLLVVGAGERLLCARPDRLAAELDLATASRLHVLGPDGPSLRLHRRVGGGPPAQLDPGLVEILAPGSLGEGWDPTPICPVCRSIAGFAPLPVDGLLDLRLLGFEHPADRWELIDHRRYSCRSCGALDRDRLTWLVVREIIRTAAVAPRCLEIAPSAALSPRLRAALGDRYESADIDRPDVDRIVDLQDLPHADDSIDLLVCSHVLEHVPDDLRAMGEIRRVLSPDGVAVLLVPISLHLDGIEEDPNLTDPVERRRRFGQADHLRTYDRHGFERRLRQSGLTVSTFGVAEVGAELLDQFAVPASGRLYLARPAGDR